MNETLVATLTVSELHNVLSNALLCASKDDTLPVLCAIKLTEHNGDVLAQSTDRYRLAEVLGNAENVDPDLNALIPVALVKQVIATLKMVVKKDAAKETVELWQSSETLTVRLSTGAVVTGVLCGGDFPKIRSLYPDTHLSAEDAAGVWAVNPASLADMMKVKHVDGSSRNQPSRLTGGRNNGKPVLVEHGDWFRGLIMPVRVQENSTLATANRF